MSGGREDKFGLKEGIWFDGVPSEIPPGSQIAGPQVGQGNERGHPRYAPSEPTISASEAVHAVTASQTLHKAILITSPMSPPEAALAQLIL